MVSGNLAIKKGYYYAVLSYVDCNGKRHQKWGATGLPQKGNKRRAQEKLTQLQVAFQPPVQVQELCSDMLFSDYLQQWLDIVKTRVKITTYSSYQSMVLSVIAPYFAQRKIGLQALEARHIQQFYSDKLKEVTANSVIHYHAVIHQALKYAFKTDLIKQNVAEKVDRPRKNSFQPNFLDGEELQELFSIVQSTKLELPVLVAAFYGLRRGEVLGLKWDAIDFQRNTLTVKQTVTK